MKKFGSIGFSSALALVTFMLHFKFLDWGFKTVDVASADSLCGCNFRASGKSLKRFAEKKKSNATRKLIARPPPARKFIEFGDCKVSLQSFEGQTCKSDSDIHLLI